MDEQGRHDLPALTHQNVVGAARGRGVHGLETDACSHQGAQQGWWWKTQLAAATEDHQLRASLEDLLEVSLGQLGQGSHRPGDHGPRGRHQDAARVGLTVHRYRVRGAGIDDVHAFGAVGLEFHVVQGGTSLWGARWSYQCG